MTKPITPPYLIRYFKNKSGQGMSEYLILVMLVAVAAITATTSVGKSVYGKLRQIHESIDQTVVLKNVRGDEG
jgi:Flp pilus assembly pilin Flp